MVPCTNRLLRGSTRGSNGGLIAFGILDRGMLCTVNDAIREIEKGDSLRKAATTRSWEDVQGGQGKG